MKRGLFIFLLLQIVSSCTYVLTETAKAIDSNSRMVPPPNNPNRFVEISIDDNYLISLPGYMLKYNKILDEALISYANEYRSLYTIVLKKDMSYFDNYKNSDEYLIDSIPMMESYKNLYLEKIIESSPNIKFEEYGLLEINDFKARQLKLFVLENNIASTQIVTLLKTEDVIYHIISWTSKEKFKKNIGIMERIPFTFEKKFIYK